jgi:hypothetical protein
LADVGIVAGSLALGGEAEIASTGIARGDSLFSKQEGQMLARLAAKHIIGGGMSSVVTSMVINHFGGDGHEYNADDFRRDMVQGIEINGAYSGLSTLATKLFAASRLGRLYHFTYQGATKPSSAWATIYSTIDKTVFNKSKRKDEIIKGGLSWLIGGDEALTDDWIKALKEVGGEMMNIHPISALKKLKAMKEIPRTYIKDQSNRLIIEEDALNDYVLCMQRSSGSGWKSLLGQYVKKSFNKEELEWNKMPSAIGRNAYQAMWLPVLGQVGASLRYYNGVFHSIMQSLNSQSSPDSNNSAQENQTLPKGVLFHTSDGKPLPISQLPEGVHVVMQKSDLTALHDEVKQAHAVSFVTTDGKTLPLSKLPAEVFLVMQKKDLETMLGELANDIIRIITDQIIYSYSPPRF